MSTPTEDLVTRLRHAAERGGGYTELAEDCIREIERLHERLNEHAKAENEHCKDCCCARSWNALGITSYTGLSIPEHILALRTQLEAVLKHQQDECND